VKKPRNADAPRRTLRRPYIRLRQKTSGENPQKNDPARAGQARKSGGSAARAEFPTPLPRGNPRRA